MEFYGYGEIYERYILKDCRTKTAKATGSSVGESLSEKGSSGVVKGPMLLLFSADLPVLAAVQPT